MRANQHVTGAESNGWQGGLPPDLSWQPEERTLLPACSFTREGLYFLLLTKSLSYAILLAFLLAETSHPYPLANPDSSSLNARKLDSLI